MKNVSFCLTFLMFAFSSKAQYRIEELYIRLPKTSFQKADTFPYSVSLYEDSLLKKVSSNYVNGMYGYFVIYEYDDEKRLINERNMTMDYSTEKIKKYYYEENGLTIKVEEELIDKRYNRVKSTTTYKFDDSKRIISKTLLDTPGNFHSTLFYKYFKKKGKNIRKEYVLKSNNKLKLVETLIYTNGAEDLVEEKIRKGVQEKYKYEYDDFGKWITKQEYNRVSAWTIWRSNYTILRFFKKIDL